MTYIIYMIDVTYMTYVIYMIYITSVGYKNTHFIKS